MEKAIAFYATRIQQKVLHAFLERIFGLSLDSLLKLACGHCDKLRKHVKFGLCFQLLALIDGCAIRVLAGISHVSGHVFENASVSVDENASVDHSRGHALRVAKESSEHRIGVIGNVCRKGTALTTFFFLHYANKDTPSHLKM